MSNDKAIKEIQLVLEQFNEAYVKQDVSKIDEFMKQFYTNSDESVIIGTAYKEWMLGTKGAKEIFLSDWNDTGVWSYDYKDAKITVKDVVAWISMTGKLTLKLPSEAIYQGMQAQIKAMLEDQEKNPDDKMWDIISSANFYLNHSKKGDKYIFPFRFTAVLVSEDNTWLFHQMHFSFPYVMTTPPVRIFE
ncbi:MAG: nuclear transport factor 2 family protein [Candidatus Heimdallarchaeota archaeon]